MHRDHKNQGLIMSTDVATQPIIYFLINVNEHGNYMLPPSPLLLILYTIWHL